MITQDFGLTLNLAIEIMEDVRDECSKFGTILEIKIPRPIGGSRQSPGVGKIFVKYDSPASTKKALAALAGRKFADRTVVTTFFPEVRLIPIVYLSLLLQVTIV
jgi:splicing factor U2AF subunit